jgi:glycerate kinase
VRLGSRGVGALARVDLSRLRPLPPDGALILSDVSNPLLGPFGAAAIFGPQKGATPELVEAMDENLARLVRAMPGGDALCESAGAGAAGGTGFGLLAWGATMAGGSGAVADAIGLSEAIRGAALVVTGEGRFDGQSAAGKAPSEVAARAAAWGVPVALVAGAIEADASGFAASASLTDLAGDGAAAMADPLRWLEAAGAQLARA